MKAKNAPIEDLERALNEINKKYDNNVIFEHIHQYGKRSIMVNFRLRVKDSHGKGARLGQHLTKKGNRRHLINACWHVHGDFFEALLKINPKAEITALNKKITMNSGHYEIWRDWNIGSLYEPLYFSEACECQ